MLNIAVISDIHGNLPALKAVLEDIDTHDVSQLYCLGDLTDAAPWHNEVIGLVRQLRIPTIMGNHDERIAFDHPVYPQKKHSPVEQAARLQAINYTKETITAENKTFLASLPRSIRLDFGGYKILLVHGSPGSNEEYLYETHPEAALLPFFDEHQADMIVGGHTHLSYIRSLSGEKMMVNAGSAGRTKEQDGMATYLLLQVDEGQVTPVIRKVAYPLEETLRGIRESVIPDFYADFLAGEKVS